MSEFDDLEGMLSKKREDDASRPEKTRQSRARAKERLEQMLKGSDFIARLDSIVEWMNTRALVEHLAEKDTDSELVQLYIKEANLYIEDIEMYFLNTEKSRLNKRLLGTMKTSDAVWMV